MLATKTPIGRFTYYGGIIITAVRPGRQEVEG